MTPPEDPGGRRSAGRTGPDRDPPGHDEREHDPAADRRRAADPESPARRRRPQRVGDLLPDAARHLGLEEELRLARATTTWDAIVAERVPAASGACRLVRIEPDALVVAVDEPIVAAELRMRALELLGAFGSAPGGARVPLLRLVGGTGSGSGGSAKPRV